MPRRDPHRRWSSFAKLRNQGPSDHGGAEPAPRRNQGDRAAHHVVPCDSAAQRSAVRRPAKYPGELNLCADQAAAPAHRSTADWSLPLPGHHSRPLCSQKSAEAHHQSPGPQNLSASQGGASTCMIERPSHQSRSACRLDGKPGKPWCRQQSESRSRLQHRQNALQGPFVDEGIHPQPGPVCQVDLDQPHPLVDRRTNLCRRTRRQRRRRASASPSSCIAVTASGAA